MTIKTRLITLLLCCFAALLLCPPPSSATASPHAATLGAVAPQESVYYTPPPGTSAIAVTLGGPAGEHDVAVTAIRYVPFALAHTHARVTLPATSPLTVDLGLDMPTVIVITAPSSAGVAVAPSSGTYEWCHPRPADPGELPDDACSPLVWEYGISPGTLAITPRPRYPPAPLHMTR